MSAGNKMVDDDIFHGYADGGICVTQLLPQIVKVLLCDLSEVGLALFEGIVKLKVVVVDAVVRDDCMRVVA